MLSFFAIGATALSGKMAMSNSSVAGRQCEYADASDGGVASPAATSPMIKTKHFCGASFFKGGAACGSCYNVSYDGTGGTNPGRAGSAIVQVVDTNTDTDLSCHLTAFGEITGATTGVFPVTYDAVPCDTASGGVATVLLGGNAYYVKAIFSDLTHAVSGAELTVSGTSFKMERAGGATWSANTDGSTGAATFKVTLTDGSVVTMDPCFDKWPVTKDTSCKLKL